MPRRVTRSRRNRPLAHVDRGFRARTHDEAIGAGDAPRIEQRIDRELGGIGGRAHQPELDERRELLAGGEAGVDREPARRQAVDLSLAERAEIAGAEEHQHLVLVFRGVQRVMHAKSGETGEAHVRLGELVVAVVELVGRVRHLAHVVADHLADMHRAVEMETRMEEHHLERQLLRAPQRVVGAKADVAVLVVVEVEPLLGQCRRRLLVRLRGQRARLALDVVEAEAVRGARDEQQHADGERRHAARGARPPRLQSRSGREGVVHWRIGEWQVGTRASAQV